MNDTFSYCGYTIEGRQLPVTFLLFPRKLYLYNLAYATLLYKKDLLFWSKFMVNLKCH